MSRTVVFGALLLSAFVVHACKRGPGSGLRGQTNTTVTFYGKAVDQDGRPLSGARFEYRLEAYPKNWTFDSRDRPNDVSTVDATSDGRGLFQFTASGCTLRRLTAERNGYRHFYDVRPQNSRDDTDSYFYSLIEWGYVQFKPHPDRPAVYVFVADGAREVSALPCRGGFDSGGGNRWVQHESAWPKKPSLKDVVYKPKAGG